MFSFSMQSEISPHHLIYLYDGVHSMDKYEIWIVPKQMENVKVCNGWILKYWRTILSSGLFNNATNWDKRNYLEVWIEMKITDYRQLQLTLQFRSIWFLQPQGLHLLITNREIVAELQDLRIWSPKIEARQDQVMQFPLCISLPISKKGMPKIFQLFLPK